MSDAIVTLLLAFARSFVESFGMSLGASLGARTAAAIDGHGMEKRAAARIVSGMERVIAPKL